MIPSSLCQHITIEELSSLSEDEMGMLLFICNIWAPIRPPIINGDEYVIGGSVLRCVKRECILDRVSQSLPIIKEEFISIYESLRNKLSIPIEKKPVNSPVESINKEEEKKPVESINKEEEKKPDESLEKPKEDLKTESSGSI